MTRQQNNWASFQSKAIKKKEGHFKGAASV
jgi:hypothetical protein